MVLNTLKEGQIVSENYSGKFDYETDLLIAGLGTAGAVCFYNAVKLGLKCIGVEKQSILGGTGTAACVQDYYYGQLSGSLLEINKKSDELTKRLFSEPNTHPTEYSNTLSAKTVVLESAGNNESSIALGCVITGVFLNNKTVCGVRAFYKNRFINIKAKIIADNTNGFVCMLAECKTVNNRKSDDKTMQASKTIAFLCDGKTKGEWSSLGFIDGLDEYALSEKYLKADTSAPILLDKYDNDKRPVFEGTLIGKRETKRIRTKYVITFDDLINFKEYEKPLFYGFASFDNVNVDLENENENLQNWIYLCYMRHMGLSFCVPLESIIPKNRDGILVIGKSLGTTHDAASLIRMKAEMEKCGEAAAYIAKLSIESDCTPYEINYNRLKDMLISSGCLNPIKYGFYELRKDKYGKHKEVNIPKTAVEIKAGLLSEKPQYALFSVLRSSGFGIREQLHIWLDSENKTLKYNSAIALGLIGDEKCLPVLREIISKEPLIHNVSNGKHYFGWLENDLWSDFIKAVILLGRFKDEKSLETLKQLKEKEFNGTMKWLRVYEYIDESIKLIEKGLRL